MADLISKDAVLERMKSMAGCATCNNYNGVRCRACIWDDAMNIVDEASTVEVIPVNWINAYMNKAYGRVRAEIIREMLDAWMEQEAR